MLKKRYILITNNFDKNQYLYFDLKEKKFVISLEKNPSVAVLITVAIVFPIVMNSFFDDKTLEKTIDISPLYAIILGITVGFALSFIYNYFSSTRNYIEKEIIPEDISKITDLGKQMFSTQKQIFYFFTAFVLIVCLFLTKEGTIKSFLLISLGSGIVTVFFNFIGFKSKKKSLHWLTEHKEDHL